MVVREIRREKRRAVASLEAWSDVGPSSTFQRSFPPLSLPFSSRFTSNHNHLLPFSIMFSLSIFKAAPRASTPLLTRSLLARPALPLARSVSSSPHLLLLPSFSHLLTISSPSFSHRAGYASINIDPAHLETYHKDVLKDLGEETNSDPDVVVLIEEEEYDVLSPPPQEILKHHGTVVAAPQPDIEINPVVLPGEKWDETKAVSKKEGGVGLEGRGRGAETGRGRRRADLTLILICRLNRRRTSSRTSSL